MHRNHLLLITVEKIEMVELDHLINFPEEYFDERLTKCCNMIRSYHQCAFSPSKQHSGFPVARIQPFPIPLSRGAEHEVKTEDLGRTAYRVAACPRSPNRLLES